MNPQEFVNKWRHVQLKERSAAQEHFLDLCQLVNHPTPAEHDPTGKKFTFEAGAAKQQGGQGFADVWKKGFFAWEYKGKHANLDKAYQQLLQYREALQNPPLLVVSDTDQIVIHTNFTNTIHQITTITLDDLLEPAGTATLRAVFYEPSKLKAAKSTEQVTREAAAEFAKLADLLRKYGEDPHRTAHFLIRLLFCLFAEDVGLLPQDLFTRLVNQTRGDSADFTTLLSQLFKAMATGGWFGVEKIIHFDGGLFDEDDLVLELDWDGKRILAQLAELDWASIEPSILGTLFERSLDPSKRSQLGAHYTSKEDILLIVEPVLMKPLRRRWLKIASQAEALATKRNKAKSASARTKANNELTRLLTGFADELTQIKVLDPACGSGNFLYVALRQLLDLWKEVSMMAGKLGLTLFSPGFAPSPVQLYGIELNTYAHELAQATVWIGYIQWLRDNGFGRPVEPILKPLHNIVQMDAILGYDEDSNPIEPDWPEAHVIVGNPPFLGSRKMRPNLGDEYCDSLLEVYRESINGLPDLVCYWFEKAHHLIATGKIRRAGLLATQAIRGGANRQVLTHIKESGNIFMAWSDREWILDGAMVHVSIVGFDNGTEKEVHLDGLPVSLINPDLTADVDLAEAQPLYENTLLSFQGVVLRGPFNISYELAEEMLSESGNPNGRPNDDVIKPRRTGQDIVSRFSNSYVVDFGVSMSIEEASQYVKPFEYLKTYVYPMRQKANQAVAREKWWIHWNPRTQMREALAKIPRYIATPRVAKHRVFVWLDANILPDAQLVVFARSDDYFLGVLHSNVHELWARRMGTQLREAESGFRYTSTTTFETFPMPWAPGNEPLEDPRVEAIAQAAKSLIEKRDNWLNPTSGEEKELRKRTLTNLYNQYPTWLEFAHQELNSTVIDAYGWSQDISDEQILENLLCLNQERSQ